MGKNILLVEDEAFIRDMYAMSFTKAGYTVDPAEDGEVALKKLSQTTKPYDLIVLDIMLPKVDGLNVLKQVKAENSPSKNIPVFLLTNLGIDKVIKEAMALGAQKYFIKANYLPKDIVAEVNKFFQTKS